MAGILDAFRQSISNHETGRVDPGRVAKAVTGIAAAFDAYSSDHSRALLTHIMVPWALAVARLAPTKWMLPAGVSPSCAMELGGHVCGSFALGGCHICGRPICIQHALIAADATICCWHCMKLAGQHATPWQPPTSASPGGAVDLGWAYELLGVEPDASDVDVRAAFKKRIAALHPDKHKDETEAHSDMIKMVKRAYDAIRASRGAA